MTTNNIMVGVRTDRCKLVCPYSTMVLLVVFYMFDPKKVYFDSVWEKCIHSSKEKYDLLEKVWPVIPEDDWRKQNPIWHYNYDWTPQ